MNMGRISEEIRQRLTGELAFWAEHHYGRQS
jgi:hypothetical protein